MHLTRPENLTFRKSSYSSTARECVEVAEAPGINAVRDTEHRERGALLFPSGEWAMFLREVQTGQL